MQSILTILALAASSALALQVTSPAQGSSLDLSKDNKVTWSSVSSDPSSFQIQLVNMAVNPPVTQTITDNVQTSSGSFDLKALKGVTPGQGYQINLVSTTPMNSGILAQSAQFTVVNAGASTTSASFSSSTPSGSLTTITSTINTDSSSSTSSSSATTTTTDSSASASGSSSSASGSGTSSASGTSGPTGSSSGSSSGSSTATSSSASGSATGNAAAHPIAGAGLGLFGLVAAVLA